MIPSYELKKTVLYFSDKPPVMINGIQLKPLKSKYPQDNTLNDVSSSLNDDTAELNYGINDIEDSLKLLSDEDRSAAGKSVNEKFDEGAVEEENSKSSRTNQDTTDSADSESHQDSLLLKSKQGLSSLGSREVTGNTSTEQGSSLTSGEKSLETVRKATADSAEDGNKGDVDDNDNDEENTADESQVLLKTGSSRSPQINLRKKTTDVTDEDSIDV